MKIYYNHSKRFGYNVNDRITKVFTKTCGFHCIKFWVVSLTSGVGKTRYPYANEWNKTLILHHTQKLTGSGLKI